MVKPAVRNLILSCRCGLLIAVVCGLAGEAIAQVHPTGYYQPLNQSARPGKVGQWGDDRGTSRSVVLPTRSFSNFPARAP